VTSNVLVTSRSFSSGRVDLEGRLRNEGFAVVRGPADHDLTALRALLRGTVAWIAGTGPVRAEHLALAPNLRVLARYGVGVDAVDLDAARASGLVVTNTPGANTEAVSEHALALLMAVLRGVPAADRRVRADHWTATAGRQLSGSVAGVVGFGKIGTRTAARLLALGCRVLVHDPYVIAAEVAAVGAQAVALDRLRAEADVVSLHAPGGALLVDRAWIRGARAGQVLVNTARADLVDEAEVARGLREGRLFGYGGDTLTGEGAGTARSPLLAPDLADRVVLTPHLGAQTVEAVDRMGTMAVDDVLAVLSGRPPQNPVLETRPAS
jgi:D-3-phosphoglycerate dehydrogenase